MNPFELEQLIWPTLLITFIAGFVSFRFTRLPVFSVLAGVLKGGIFLWYFLIFDGTYTFSDDWAYFKGGVWLAHRDVSVSNLVDNWEVVKSVGRGDHFIYYLFNAYAFRIFGEEYFAPVALNIVITVFIAFFGARVATSEFRLTKREEHSVYTFLLFHPDILAWSTVMNGKDILVLFLHILLFWSVSLLFRQQVRAALLLAVPTSLVLFYLRFYVPFLFVVALATSSVFSVGRKSGLAAVFVSVAMMLFVYSWVGSDRLTNAHTMISEHEVGFLYGFVRFLLTPIPFQTELSYQFLDIPALIHWMLLPFAFFGILAIFRFRSPFSRFFLVYLLVFTALYSVFGELQGPRHRVQLDFAIAILQFMGLRAAYRLFRPATKPVAAYVPNYQYSVSQVR